jgi:hypothetical protein
MPRKLRIECHEAMDQYKLPFRREVRALEEPGALHSHADKRLLVLTFDQLPPSSLRHISKVVEEHRRRGIPLAVWRVGRAVSIPATEAAVLRETPVSYRTKSAASES